MFNEPDLQVFDVLDELYLFYVYQVNVRNVLIPERDWRRAPIVTPSVCQIMPHVKKEMNLLRRS